MTDEQYIDIAIEISKNAKYPYGAIVVKDNQIIGRSDENTLMETSMYSHAELEAIESASKNKNLYGDLNGATMYVSCEPCMMCMGAIYSIVDFKVLNDGDKYNINGIEYIFFDIQAKGTKQFGFECSLNGKKLAFLGDETLNPNLYGRIRNFDYVMHEAFCLDSEENIFHAYEKNHSTTRSVSEVMNKLEVKNLILYHTEESHKEKRKELYTKEAQDYFNGNVIVPNDLEIIDIM